MYLLSIDFVSSEPVREESVLGDDQRVRHAHGDGTEHRLQVVRQLCTARVTKHHKWAFIGTVVLYFFICRSTYLPYSKAMKILVFYGKLLLN